MGTILFWYFMEGIKYTPYVYNGVSVITLTSPLQFPLAILIVADTYFRKFEVDREFWYLRIRMGFIWISKFLMFIIKIFISKFDYHLKKNRKTSIFINKPKFY